MPPLKYTLPDAGLFSNTHKGVDSVIWKPQNTSIVLGNSNNMEQSLHLDRILRDNIPVYKRPSGGQAVLLSPNTLVISAVKFRGKLENAMKYFRLFNEKVIRAMTSLGISNLQPRGISDIALGERKILGSAIYQDKDKVFYHAVLNVGEPADNIEKYLKHPPREPDYRNGRPHRNFVTSIYDQGYHLDIEEIREVLAREFIKNEPIH